MYSAIPRGCHQRPWTKPSCLETGHLLPLPWHLALASAKHSLLDQVDLRSDQNKLSLSSKGRAHRPGQLCRGLPSPVVPFPSGPGSEVGAGRERDPRPCPTGTKGSSSGRLMLQSTQGELGCPRLPVPNLPRQRSRQRLRPHT